MTSSLAALKLFRENPQHFDLIITDLTMPHLTGEKLATAVTAIRPDMPVILSTGFSDLIVNETIQRCDITAFIPKPCKKDVLAHTIRMALKRA